ncbi:P-loop containing nucleoside triphosphate hydrolase protein [Suillus tomentosus]|nr:P-loop containing nucleoside triphosphate hydrolase protein [Suillus tomentosus]
MPRRTRAELPEGDTDSLKENSALSNGVKDLVKKEKVKDEKGKGKARRIEPEPVDEESDQTQADDNADVDADGDVDTEGDVDADGDPENVDGSPRSRKRTRVNAEGDFAPSTPKREQVATLPRDADGFIPGSIVRIQLHNFLTYDWVEFRPGPYLNMILGPNGTGKSSIACAICLGLNWPPSILGRANEISSFVKHGKESGYIEIELKGAKGQKNLVIRRNLSAKSKSSTLTLNGQSCTGKEITNRMAKLNVQVGNLCSFLPQDKVSEFAQMTPQQLLRETQRAAGDVNLSNWHDTLITAGKELKNLQDVCEFSALTSPSIHRYLAEIQ